LFHEQILPELLQNGVSAREAIEAKGLSQVNSFLHQVGTSVFAFMFFDLSDNA
jgi:ACT domain-containing protein